jgi:hypothetical protein
MMDGLSVNQGWALVLGLVLRGVAPASPLITSDDAAWRLVASSLVCALARCVPLVAKTLSWVWLYCRV